MTALTARESRSALVIERLGRLLEKSVSLASRVESRLRDFCHPDAVGPDAAEVAGKVSTSIWDQMHDILDVIEESLRRIDSTIDRFD